MVQSASQSRRLMSQRIMVAEMRRIRWMYGYTRLDRIRNEAIREKLEVESIEDNMKETKLRRFDHVKKGSVNARLRR